MRECSTDNGSCCEVQAVVTVDARGQLVLPKDVREAAGIKGGDKLAIVAMSDGDQVCCLSLMKVSELSGMVRSFLGPVAQEINREGV